jgi:PIN domain nuclease of toxin-antitoxin system
MNGEPLACSPISLYEIAYSSFRERLELHDTRENFIASVQEKIKLAPITAQITICAGELPLPFHGDPGDRIITATAIVTGSALITKDERIRESNLCKTIW